MFPTLINYKTSKRRSDRSSTIDYSSNLPENGQRSCSNVVLVLSIPWVTSLNWIKMIAHSSHPAGYEMFNFITRRIDTRFENKYSHSLDNRSRGISDVLLPTCSHTDKGRCRIAWRWYSMDQGNPVRKEYYEPRRGVWATYIISPQSSSINLPRIYVHQSFCEYYSLLIWRNTVSSSCIK